MSDLVIAQKQDLINIADAIREKTETTDGMGIDEMAALIAAIESGGRFLRKVNLSQQATQLVFLL